ncbi:class III chitinase [Coprinopsis cinerea okayama7|uniref:chitinase n=1 Tax=Coprinopsis cinerea (strain Okayama-7 / 130 / ATCC MYA-4618 / FGSC 9003) TaxID=240176 RepID=A8N0I6_COPC7|nr:class III chitinase [Coprinopsis cinerea okayama7\|eukprot:XP_001828436.2 class III chitinase [Coprinopsis cinerea okayama7\
MLVFCTGLVLLLAVLVKGFDNNRFDNVAVYWGQNSYGAGHSDLANHQKRLSFYCNDNAIDVFPVAFLHVFFGPGGVPSINLANICNAVDNSTFPGTQLPDCSALASDIASCQSKGKIVTLSLGGATGAVGFESDSQAVSFAQTVWDMFLGGRSDMRPFGNAVLDGVDLDIEGGTSGHYGAFVNKIRALAAPTGKKYYVTAAPQCVYPDAALGEVLNQVAFDAVYGMFYNNYCGLQNFDQASNWNFGLWYSPFTMSHNYFELTLRDRDYWARNVSVSKNTKIYIGAPAAPSAAGSGYVDIGTLSRIATQMRRSFPSFGGVMLWDASQAYANNRFDKAIKDALAAAGGSGFAYPPCSAPAYVSGTGYQSGAQVSYGGYIWQAKWFASQTPGSIVNGEWSAVSVCSGGGSPAPPPPPPPSSSTTTTTTTTRSSTTTTRSTTSTSTSTTTTGSSTPAPPAPTGGLCAGVSAWSSSVAYDGGSKVVYSGRLWTAKWWTQADIPGGLAGVWVDNGPC